MTNAGETTLNKRAGGIALRTDVRLMVRAVAGLAALAAVAAGRPEAAAGAEFTVNSTTDAVDVNPGDGLCETADGECTLRAAVQETNGLPGGDAIMLPAGTYTIGLAGDDFQAAVGDLDILDDLTINGAGPAETILDGGGLDRVFEIIGPIFTAGAEVEMSGLTVRNGSSQGGGGIRNQGLLTLVDVVVKENRTTVFGQGGGITSFFVASLTMVDSVVSSNVADGEGGGIFAVGELTSTNTIIAGNRALSRGGGIAGGGGLVLTMNGGVLSDNVATLNNGGGIDNSGETVITDTTIVANSAGGDCGGITNNAGSLTVEGSTISENTAGIDGGGICNFGIDGEACVPESPPGCVLQADATLVNVTISGNTAGGAGGAIYSAGFADDIPNDAVLCEPGAPPDCIMLAEATLTNVTMTGNSAATASGMRNEGISLVTATNTILANEGSAPQCVGGIVSAGHNVDSGGTCGLTGTGDLQNTDPLLAPLGDYGGATQTHALLAGSPAIDAGDESACPAIDQRGVARPVDGDADGVAACDIGAYEAAAPQPVPTPGASPAPAPAALPPTGGRPLNGGAPPAR